jgi:hypothetical protein
VSRKKVVVWVVVGVAAAAAAATVALLMHHWRPGSITIEGAVIRRDEDTRKERPIADAAVTAWDGVSGAGAQSDASGFFKITLPGVGWPGRTINLSFRHPSYEPLDLKVQPGIRLATRALYIAAMTPGPAEAAANPGGPVSVVSNIRIRYTVNTQTDVNIGSAVKTFQVINKGNAPCNGQQPCSPDGVWKASIGSASLDAGPDNEFRDVRASCIAGPCPFTRIDSSGFANGSRNLTVSATDWSDTATFLLEAEVFRTAISSNVRTSYPVTFGRTLNFTLPPTQEGVSIEADVDGTPMVFPLGPELYLSWADCTARTGADPEKTTVYRCELKPGYRF